MFGLIVTSEALAYEICNIYEIRIEQKNLLLKIN